MRPTRPLIRPLFILGAVSAAASGAVGAVDTSQWKCESCPFEKEGRSGALELGVGAVSQDSAKFGDYTGLDQKGAYVIAGVSAQGRGANGLYGSVTASDLGLDTRSLAAEVGQEGEYRARLGYAETPRHLSNGALTPFIGSGGAVLSLPAGYPAGDTSTMPLASTLHPVELGYKRSRFDAGVSWLMGREWSTQLSVRHDVRDGTQRLSGSFFSTASQLIAPVDQVTDQLEVSASYFTRQWQGSLSYQASMFRNGPDALTWANPFTPIVDGADRGQLALAPDNQFHQIVASLGGEILPQVRLSAELATGRMAQDAAYLAPTLNESLAALLPALPAASLHGRVDTFNASLRLSATPIDHLRLNASYATDQRDNRTPSESYPAVSTDMFLGATPRSNQPFSFTRHLWKLNADYAWPGQLRTSAGAEQDDRNRTLQAVTTTRETTLWGRVSVQALENLSLAGKYAHAERVYSSYGVAGWIDPPENPLLRKFYLAERSRDQASLRADASFGDNISAGLDVGFANDNYPHSRVGLIDGRSIQAGADVSIALSDDTHVHLFAQTERSHNRQDGSQLFAEPDWTGRSRDAVDLAGVGVKHIALKGQLELAADLTVLRSRSDIAVNAGPITPPFPTTQADLDSLKLRATYRVSDSLSVVGQYWHERYAGQDWRLDGVLPGTIPNLLALGDQVPRYHVNVIGVAMRYRF